ncbi:MAG: carboxypeptidase regulatory-like domain-containing protein, partial [Nocardioidaceae bacterium]
TVEHPLTEGLPSGERAQVLVPGHEWSAFEGYSGRTVADVHTDDDQTVGGGIGYLPRGTGSVHVLLASLAAAPWGNPETEWLESAHTVLGNAVEYAMDAEFGQVGGTVTDAAGAGLPATVTDVATGDRATAAADGAYRLLLTPGAHTLRFTHPGTTAVERTVDVVVGETDTVDVALAAAGAGVVDGTVVDADGATVAGAEVRLVDTDHVATTGADGAYSIVDVPAATYTLRVTATGFGSASLDVEVVAGQSTSVDVTLRKAARVAVVGDFRDQIGGLLQEAEMVAEPLAWTQVDRVDEFDVVVFNDPTDPGAETFGDWLDALDAARVSGVFAADRFSSDGGARLLRKYTGNPAAIVPVDDSEGDVSYRAVDPDHPVFAGAGAEPAVLRADRYGAVIEGYGGLPLADLVTETGGDRGVGATYQPRTTGSVHLLLGGLTATIIQNPPDDWTDAGERLYADAVAWAADPGLGGVEGVVTGAEGAPVSGTVSVVGTEQEAATGADGRFTLPLPVGDYTVRVEAFGYRTVERAVTVDAGGITAADVALTPLADVGTVTGTVTVDGAPVADAAVRLVGQPRSTTTGPDGTYRLDLVEPGDYELEATAAGHVRYRADVTVSASASVTHDVGLRTSPRVGVLDDFEGRLSGYLTYWGYQPEAIGWADTDRLAELDLVVANLASSSGFDPGADAYAAFDEAALRAEVSVVWLDQFGRGSFRYLQQYVGNPGVAEEGRNDGVVTAIVDDAGHPVTAGLPAAFELTGVDAEYSWFDEFDGTTLARVTAEEAEGGGLVGVQDRGAAGVDVLLGTLSVSTYGYPAYGSEPGREWTTEAERLLRNALAYAVDAPGRGAQVEGTLRSSTGPLAGTVAVVETGRTYDVDADGGFLVALAPGTWTLRGDTFGYTADDVMVTVEPGQSMQRDIVLDRDPLGVVAGTVTDPDGAPIAGADVLLDGTPLSATTGADGTYRIIDIPVGDWPLQVSAAGFQRDRRSVEVTEGQTTTADAQLRASRAVAVVGDYRSSVQGLLTDDGYAVTPFTTSQLATLAGRVADFDVVVMNAGVSSTNLPLFGQVVDAAAQAE